MLFLASARIKFATPHGYTAAARPITLPATSRSTETMGIKTLVRPILIWALPTVFAPIIRIMPARLAFALLVMADITGLPSASLARFYAARAARRMTERPAARFSSPLTDRFPASEARTLYWIGAYREGVEVLTRTGAAVRSETASLIMARLLFELAEFDRARSILQTWSLTPEVSYQRGLLELLVGNEQGAIPLLVSGVLGMPALMRPHQNLSARVSIKYSPNSLDAAASSLGHLYDAYNYLGQRVTHVGAGHLGVALYGGALRAQHKLRSSWPYLSEPLRAILGELEIPLEGLRLLPAEWVTQIGHLGMLDILFRMRELGWWRGRPVLLAPLLRIANQAMLSLFVDPCAIVYGDDDASGLFAELASLQRYCGMSFNVFELPGGDLVPWQEAGAMMIRQWEAEGRGYPLRDRYDSAVGSLDELSTNADTIKKQWGMGPDDWYVCLHLRDASHYNEATGAGQTHRNAEVSSYLPMIEHITGQGGWVVKLGGPKSPKLPPMKRLIDYARSPFKSEAMDLHLIRHARFFVGTTSGLTNVAVSFGVPCALVNCITVDAQLWGNRVRFALKPVRTREGRMLSQQELTTTPWRWCVYSAEKLLQHDIVALQNTADEILETVKEVEGLASGKSYEANWGGMPTLELLERWRLNLGLPHFYGNARPSMHFLQKYGAEFLPKGDTSEALQGRIVHVD